MSHDVVERDPGDPMALQSGDRFGGLSELVTLARLDLDEHDHLAVARDDVNFSTPRAVAPGKYCVPATGQLFAREILAGFSKGDAGLRHDPIVLQNNDHHKTTAENVRTASFDRLRLNAQGERVEPCA